MSPSEDAVTVRYLQARPVSPDFSCPYSHVTHSTLRTLVLRDYSVTGSYAVLLRLSKGYT